jgi:hypothetical protein
MPNTAVVVIDTELFNDNLAEWERFYNYARPTAAWVAKPLRTTSAKDIDLDRTDDCQLHGSPPAGFEPAWYG